MAKPPAGSSLLFAAPFLGKAASSYQEISIDKDNVLSPPSGVTITAQTLIDDGAGNISLSSASSSHISTHEWPHGFGVTGSNHGGDATEIGYHNASGLSEKITIEFDEIVPEIGFATAWLADVENDGVYKMYREGTLVKTGAVVGVTDRVDPPVNLSSDDGYGFDKIEFTANGWQSDYLIHKITFDVTKADNAGTASVDELDDASNQDIGSQTGNLSVSDADNAGTITASIVGDPITTLNGNSYTLPASANALIADGAMSISPTSQTWGGSWTPITWTYNPASADLDFVPAGQDLVVGHDIRLNDGTNNSNTVRVEITIVGENDAPSISDATYTLAEDTSAGTIFHDTNEDSTANDTDIESETITYSITAGNPDGIFVIDTNNGKISIAAGKSLNHELATQHILTVEASDSSESNTANVTVNLTVDTAAPSPPSTPSPSPSPSPEPTPTPEIQTGSTPNLLSAIIRGDQITLQFDDVLSDTLPRLNNFTLKNGSRELKFKDVEVIASAGQVTLISNTAIDSTAAVMLDYFDLASDQRTGVIQSRSGVDLASFSGFQLNNQTNQENNLAIDDGEFEENTITLSLNAPIGSAVPSTKRFKVKAGRKSQKIVGINTDPSEGIITLTTKKPVGSYESLKVSYKDLAGDQTKDVIEDKSGNDMDTIRDFEIINGGFNETPPKLVSAELDDDILTMEFDSIISNTKLSKNRFKVQANGKKLKVKSASIEGNDESFVNLVVKAKRNQIIDLQTSVTLSYSDAKGDQSKRVIEDLFGNDLLSVNSFFVDIV